MSHHNNGRQTTSRSGTHQLVVVLSGFIEQVMISGECSYSKHGSGRTCPGSGNNKVSPNPNTFKIQNNRRQDRRQS